MPKELVWFVPKLLAAERRRRGTPRGSRALSCFWQAVLGLRWLRDHTTADALARDHGISRATGYRYLDEVIMVLAAQAPELREALERAQGQLHAGLQEPSEDKRARDPRQGRYRGCQRHAGGHAEQGRLVIHPGSAVEPDRLQIAADGNARLTARRFCRPLDRPPSSVAILAR